jgi:hypothetical protein
MLTIKEIGNEVNIILNEITLAYFPEDPEIAKCIKNHPLSHLVAAAPFLSGSKFPERYAVANIGTLISSSTAMKKYFVCQPSESIESRLRAINHFEKPKDTAVIKKAMLILELFALVDYQQDMEEDKKSGKYNPLNGTLDFDKEKERLFSTMRKYQTPELDKYMNFDDPQSYYDREIPDLIRRKLIWFCWCFRVAPHAK